MKRIVATLVVLAVLGALGWGVRQRLAAPAETGSRGGARGPVPVEAAPVERGTIEERRTFSGSLEPKASLVVASKVGGRIESVLVDLGDPVRRGQEIAALDSDEFDQAVAQADADLLVAKANLAEATSALDTAGRDYERVKTLHGRGVASDSQLDAAEAKKKAAEAAEEVARAQIRRAEAALAAARIRRSYTVVEAVWTEGDDERVVSERHVDPGNTVAANAPLVTIVEIDPLTATVYVTEKDYPRLAPGQGATLTTDAWPDREFPARIARLAPVFRPGSRQARVELEVANPERLLKPGMFVRATVVLDRAEDATIVPVTALVQRDGATGLFVLNEAGDAVSFRPVRVGIRGRERVQVSGEGIRGRVVTLGQQLLTDGSAIRIPESAGAAAEVPEPAAR